MNSLDTDKILEYSSEYEMIGNDMQELVIKLDKYRNKLFRSCFATSESEYNAEQYYKKFQSEVTELARSAHNYAAFFQKLYNEHMKGR